MSKQALAAVFGYLILLASAASTASAEPGAGSFRMMFETREFGPLEAVVRFSDEGDERVGRSSSRAAVALSSMAIEPWRSGSTLTMRLKAESRGLFAGTIHVPRLDAKMRLKFSAGGIEGEVLDGPLAGKVSGTPWVSARPLRNYPAVLAAMDAVLAQALFDPRQLRAPRFLRFRTNLGRVAASTEDDVDLVFAFASGWDKKVFSHFALQRVSRSEIVADTDANARPAVELRGAGGVAILRVNTFLGNRAAEQLKAAFATLSDRPPPALIVDLRATPGGSLAVRHLIDGLAMKPDTLGWFVSNSWWRSNQTLPTPERLAAEPLDDFSNPEKSVERLNTVGLVKVAIPGAAKPYTGPVFVLVDAKTASVAELAAAALQGLRRAKLIGERTAGEVLSADTIPLPDGFSLLLPLADYFDARLGRLEGKGVEPDIAVASHQALDHALGLAAAAR